MKEQDLLDWQNPKVRSWIYQILLVLALGYLLYSMTSNVLINLASLGIQSGFSFLNETAGFSIIFSLIDYDETSTYFDSFVVSVINTIVLSVAGVILASVLGFTIGIMRLSNNWLVAKTAYFYVETLRNVPLLLQILLWYHAVLGRLISPRFVFEQGDEIWYSLTNSGLQLPQLIAKPDSIIVLFSFIISVVVSIIFYKWNKKRHIKTGKILPSFWINFAIIAGFIILSIVLTGIPFDAAPAVMGRFRFIGGTVIIPGFIAMLFALSFYTAAFIAEIVRSGIQAISKGQTEASLSLGLSNTQTIKFIIIPQAMRIIIPPLTNQFLNLTKNSSLAAAIAYPDLVAVFAGTVLNITGKVFEILAITMAVYLTLSLATSALMNWYNYKIRLIER